VQAKLARFYGWEAEKIATMPAYIGLKYFKAIESLEAQELLSKMKLLDYQSNMKNEARKKYHKELKKIAEKFTPKKTQSMDDFESLVQGLISG
jgi:hypothetical protein